MHFYLLETKIIPLSNQIITLPPQELLCYIHWHGGGNLKQYPNKVEVSWSNAFHTPPKIWNSFASFVNAKLFLWHIESVDNLNITAIKRHIINNSRVWSYSLKQPIVQSTQKCHSDMVVYTSMNKKHVKMGLFCCRSHNVRFIFRSLTTLI